MLSDHEHVHALMVAGCAPIQGEKLREMLLQHGSFRAVEVELEKRSTQTSQSDKKGGWETELSMAAMGYTQLHDCTLIMSLACCT